VPDPKKLMDAKDIRKAILEADDIRQEPVEAWGLTLTVRGLTGAQRDEWESSIIRMSPDGRKVTPNMRNYRAKLIAMCIVDAQGKRVFNYLRHLSQVRVCFFGHTHVPVAFIRDSMVRGGTYSKFKIEPGKLVAKGFGRQRLKNPKLPLAGENRRVQIVNLSK